MKLRVLMEVSFLQVVSGLGRPALRAEQAQAQAGPRPAGGAGAWR
jgi:hypothetical protein